MSRRHHRSFRYESWFGSPPAPPLAPPAVAPHELPRFLRDIVEELLDFATDAARTVSDVMAEPRRVSRNDLSWWRDDDWPPVAR